MWNEKWVHYGNHKPAGKVMPSIWLCQLDIEYYELFKLSGTNSEHYPTQLMRLKTNARNITKYSIK